MVVEAQEEITQSRKSIIVLKDHVFDLNEFTDDQLRAFAAAAFSVQMKRAEAVRLLKQSGNSQSSMKKK